MYIKRPMDVDMYNGLYSDELKSPEKDTMAVPQEKNRKFLYDHKGNKIVRDKRIGLV